MPSHLLQRSRLNLIAAHAVQPDRASTACWRQAEGAAQKMSPNQPAGAAFCAICNRIDTGQWSERRAWRDVGRAVGQAREGAGIASAASVRDSRMLVDVAAISLSRHAVAKRRAAGRISSAASGGVPSAISAHRLTSLPRVAAGLLCEAGHD